MSTSSSAPNEDIDSFGFSSTPDFGYLSEYPKYPENPEKNETDVNHPTNFNEPSKSFSKQEKKSDFDRFLLGDYIPEQDILDLNKVDVKPKEFCNTPCESSFYNKPHNEYNDECNGEYNGEYNDATQVSLKDFDSHHHSAETDFQEATIPFTQNSPVLFPSNAKDLFLGQNSPHCNQEYVPVDWQTFLDFCSKENFPEEYIPYLRLSSAKIQKAHEDNDDEQVSGGTPECVVRMPSDIAMQQLSHVRGNLEKKLRDFLGKNIKIRYTTDVYERRTLVDMMEAMQKHPQIQMLQKEFGASLLRCSDLRKH